MFQEDHCTGKGLKAELGKACINWSGLQVVSDRNPTHTGLNKIRTYWFILRIKYKSGFKSKDQFPFSCFTHG